MILNEYETKIFTIQLNKLYSEFQRCPDQQLRNIILEDIVLIRNLLKYG